MLPIQKLDGNDTKVLKCLYQCFARLRSWKSVSSKTAVVGFVNSRHFSNIEVVQNTDVRI